MSKSRRRRSSVVRSGYSMDSQIAGRLTEDSLFAEQLTAKWQQKIVRWELLSLHR